MLNEACGMYDFINGCESSADAVVNVNVRKVAGLHWLHELALLKELQSEPQTLSLAMAMALKNKPGHTGGQSKLTARQLALVLAHAWAELEHMKSLPPTSHKWTWGIDITENDVLASNPMTKSNIILAKIAAVRN